MNEPVSSTITASRSGKSDVAENKPARTAERPENVPSVSGAPSQGGDTRTPVPPERSAQTPERQDTESGSRPADRERVEHPARQPGERNEPERGGGIGAAEHLAPERAAGGGREARPRGADGRPVESPTPEEPERTQVQRRSGFRTVDEACGGSVKRTNRFLSHLTHCFGLKYAFTMKSPARWPGHFR